MMARKASPPADQPALHPVSPEGEAQTDLKIPERPQLAPGIELKGQMQESAFKDPPWLVERDRQYIQLPRFLYSVAEHANGQRSIEEIAQAVSEATDREVTPENVRVLLARLVLLGIVPAADGAIVGSAEKGQSRTRSPLAVNMKMAMVSPSVINPMTKTLQLLYLPPVLIVVLLAALIAEGWVFFVHGIGGSIHEAFYTPGLLLAVAVLIVLSAGFHELGHAAALRYGGGEVGSMGAGLYIVYPAFYTDVTDNYRLPRWARVRTDLGGFYFNLIFALGLVGLYFLTGKEFFLFMVLLVNLEIIHQLLPFVRLDGYWALADVTGIPDFFTQILPFLRSVLPEWVPLPEGPAIAELKPWAKLFFGAYILITIPLLCYLLFLMVRGVPRILATAWGALGHQLTLIPDAFSRGDMLTVLAAAVQMLLLTLPVLGLGYTLFTLGKRLATTVWAWSSTSPTRRMVGAIGTVAAMAGLWFLWAPQLPFKRDTPGPLYATTKFTPIDRNERLTVADLSTGAVVTVTPTPSATPEGTPAAGGAPGMIAGTETPTSLGTPASGTTPSLPAVIVTATGAPVRQTPEAVEPPRPNTTVTVVPAGITPAAPTATAPSLSTVVPATTMVPPQATATAAVPLATAPAPAATATPQRVPATATVPAPAPTTTALPANTATSIPAQPTATVPAASSPVAATTPTPAIPGR